MKTVLVIAPNIKPYPGGAEIYISELMHNLPSEEWHIICVTENVSDHCSDNINYIPLIADINRIRSCNTVTWREMFFSLLDQLTELENKKIDIIHANSMEACIIGKIISLQLGNVPIVATIHEHMPELKSFGYGRVGLVFDCLKLDGIIAPSSYYYKRTLAYGFDRTRIFKVMHGIDADSFINFKSKKNLKKKAFLIYYLLEEYMKPKDFIILLRLYVIAISPVDII